ncbi:WD_0033/WD_0034 family tandem repeat-containing protein [Wolbachia endosymbiont (group B) of Emmelina monodactyla]|uniref:WD_0033/WD_0034 family tandem repeat-containing protein n=1 Tax=Wolbachia endosymbiont (group B) of Emmelina monodactyla TaxID=2954003 RepID=UPI002230AB8D|nr:hypothetical protein [Wolbachia endosymbiont (group B) of Emmelina monodactyla]
MYTLTSLGFAIHHNKGRYINVILTTAQENGILQDILSSRNIVQYLSIIACTLTPLNFAIYKGNNECVNSTLIRAKNSSMLQDAFTEVSTVLFPYGRYTLNACELAVVVNENNASIRTALDNVSISSRYVRENSKVN